MGLAGPKHRRKLAEDPNNTKWSRDSSTFGQKILRAHGWQPGQFLGNQDADSSLRSAASSAPIKILLKDDNLGLGAKVRQKQSDECTGLDTFKDLLGRLNGKSEETIEKERNVRSEFKTSLYVERKFGLMRFVKGGMLVGDPISDFLKSRPSAKASDTEDTQSAVVTDDGVKTESKKEKKSKKRRAEESDSLDSETIKEKHRKKKKKQSKGEPLVENATTESAAEDSDKKKNKKHKKHHKDSEPEDDDKTDPGDKEKRKEKKRRNKEGNVESDVNASRAEDTDADGKKKKKKRKHHHHHPETSSGDTSTVEDTAKSTITSSLDSGTSTPITSGTSTPSAISNRHLARSRYVAAKRLALADAQALNQIFMVKPV